MGKLIEGLWDCPTCGKTGIRAGLKECPGCGTPQDKNTKFRMPGTISYVPEKEAAKISRNPDWECRYCGSLNKDTEITCKGCGASKDGTRNYFEMRTEEDAKKIEKDEEYMSDYSYSGKNEQQTYTHTAPKQNYYVDVDSKNSATSILSNIWNNILSIWPYILGGVGVIAFIAIMIALFMPHDKKVQVTDFSWTRSIAIEEEQTFNESGWHLPSGARLAYTRSEIKSYEQVLDHYETVTEQKSKQVISGYETVVTGHRDLGNGYFEEITSQRPIYTTEYYTETRQEPVYRSEPVYATKYYYEIDKWVVVDHVRTNASDKDPYWGDVTLVGKQREGSYSETYTITVISDKNTEKEKVDTYNIDREQWDKLENGDIIIISVNALGIVSEIKYPEQQGGRK